MRFFSSSSALCTTLALVVWAATSSKTALAVNVETPSLSINKDIDFNEDDHTRSLQSSRCGCSSCSSAVLGRDAGGFPVGDRIDWVKNNLNKSESRACKMVCGDEFPGVCGSQCDPTRCSSGGNGSGGCSNSPSNWHDSDGSKFNCEWYAQDNNCQRYGGKYANRGKTANQACCACGGGSTNPQPSPSPPSPSPPSPSPPSGGGGSCGCNSCSSTVLNRDAGGHKVGDRIDWLEANMNMSEQQACETVCGSEFPGVCEECNPGQCGSNPNPNPNPNPSPNPPSPSPPSGGGRPKASFNEGLNSNIRSRGMLPYLFDNKSRYSRSEIYIAVVGIVNGQASWMDLSNFNARPMSSSFNTRQGPSHDPTGFRYANIFTRLSDISSNTIGIPRIAGCKMFISFKKPLYVHFHASGGYTQPDLNNPNDVNRGIRFETIELTWAPNGLWINTSRVDAYQYPMGLEVYGSNVGGGGNYKKVGELKDHNDILNLWPSRVSSAFRPCYVTSFYPEGDGIIKQPSKISQFQQGGSSANYFQNYINQIWNIYKTRDLQASFGDIGTWRGRVASNNVLTMRCVAQCPGDAVPGTVQGIPNTQEVIEAKGKLARGGTWDMNVQKMVAAAINRNVIDLNGSGTQNWGNRSTFYQTNPNNQYAKFFHGFDISFNSETYAFSFDDVFEQSSTIQANGPDKTRISIGGFYNVQGH